MPTHTERPLPDWQVVTPTRQLRGSRGCLWRTVLLAGLAVLGGVWLLGTLAGPRQPPQPTTSRPAPTPGEARNTAGQAVLLGLGEPVTSYVAAGGVSLCDGVYTSGERVAALTCKDDFANLRILRHVGEIVPIVVPGDASAVVPLSAHNPQMGYDPSIRGGYYTSRALAAAMPDESAGFLGPGTFYVYSMPQGGPGFTFQRVWIGAGNIPMGSDAQHSSTWHAVETPQSPPAPTATAVRAQPPGTFGQPVEGPDAQGRYRYEVADHKGWVWVKP